MGLMGAPRLLSPLGSQGGAAAGPRRGKVVSQELADGESCFPGVAREECKSSEVLISPVITVRQVSAWSWATPAPGMGARWGDAAGLSLQAHISPPAPGTCLLTHGDRGGGEAGRCRGEHPQSACWVGAPDWARAAAEPHVLQPRCPMG